jgi:hypothetical protein
MTSAEWLYIWVPLVAVSAIVLLCMHSDGILADVKHWFRDRFTSINPMDVDPEGFESARREHSLDAGWMCSLCGSRGGTGTCRCGVGRWIPIEWWARSTLNAPAPLRCDCGGTGLVRDHSYRGQLVYCDDCWYSISRNEPRPLDDVLAAAPVVVTTEVPPVQASDPVPASVVHTLDARAGAREQERVAEEMLIAAMSEDDNVI